MVFFPPVLRGSQDTSKEEGLGDKSVKEMVKGRPSSTILLETPGSCTLALDSICGIPTEVPSQPMCINTRADTSTCI